MNAIRKPLRTWHESRNDGEIRNLPFPPEENRWGNLLYHDGSAVRPDIDARLAVSAEEQIDRDPEPMHISGAEQPARPGRLRTQAAIKSVGLMMKPESSYTRRKRVFANCWGSLEPAGSDKSFNTVGDVRMGRKNSSIYRKDLHQQAYDRLTGMQAFGESKKEAMADGTAKDKIFSFATYATYWKHIKYFVQWVGIRYPDCTTLKSAKRYVREWLENRAGQTDENGKPLRSAWTIQTEAAALNKLYGIDRNDPERFNPPVRHREDIQRSREAAVRDKHFSKTNNAELIAFCRGTGCRRNVLEKLEGRDLWSRRRMEEERTELEKSRYRTVEETTRLKAIRDALTVFPDQDLFIYHRKDKGGRDRFSPIIGPDREVIAGRMRRTGSHEKVWAHVHSGADIHGYRADYAATLYRMYARPIEKIPYDQINRGTDRRYQSGVYICRKDEFGRRLDREAMFKCSKALGHNRISVVADHYLRGL